MAVYVIICSIRLERNMLDFEKELTRMAAWIKDLDWKFPCDGSAFFRSAEGIKIWLKKLQAPL